jgi:hypothetical protein
LASSSLLVESVTNGTIDVTSPDGMNTLQMAVSIIATIADYIIIMQQGVRTEERDWWWLDRQEGECTTTPLHPKPLQPESPNPIPSIACLVSVADHRASRVRSSTNNTSMAVTSIAPEMQRLMPWPYIFMQNLDDHGIQLLPSARHLRVVSDGS